MDNQAEYLSERIEFEEEMVAMAPEGVARRIHEELAIHYRSKLALLKAEQESKSPTLGRASSGRMTR